MCPQPKGASCGGSIDTELAPPSSLVPAAVYLAMMAAAERDGELVADLAAERRCLRKAQMMGIGGPAAADEARLLGD